MNNVRSISTAALSIMVLISATVSQGMLNSKKTDKIEQRAKALAAQRAQQNDQTKALEREISDLISDIKTSGVIKVENQWLPRIRTLKVSLNKLPRSQEFAQI